MEKVVVILGQTATGKSDLAVRLAKKFDGEVISADSRQVYRGLNLGTGKITKREMQNIPHYLLDVASPRNTFTAADFRTRGRRAVAKIIAKNKLPIVCGGSGFYIDALLYDLPLPEVPPDKKLRRELETKTTEELVRELEERDPERARMIDRKNRRRLVRALEIVRTTGKPVGTGKREVRYEVLKIGIKFPPEELRKRIRLRLEKRMRAGMLAEAQKLHGAGLSFRRMEELGLEYRYLARYMEGKLSRAEMMDQLETEIWRYAKRQMTWFKRDKEIHWVKPAKADKLVRDFVNEKPARKVRA